MGIRSSDNGTRPIATDDAIILNYNVENSYTLLLLNCVSVYGVYGAHGNQCTTITYGYD